MGRSSFHRSFLQKWEAAELECVTGCGDVPEFESGTSPDDSVCELRSGEGVNHVVELLSAGLDEVPGVYKDIHTVMAAQTDLVDVLGQFDPKLVKMCPAGDRAED